MSLEDRLRSSLAVLLADEPPPDLVQRAVANLPSPGPRRRVPISSFVPLIGAVGILAAVIGVLSLQYARPAGDGSIAPGAAPTSSGEPSELASLLTPTPVAVIESTEPSLAATAMPTPATAPPTSMALTEKQRSDRFWNSVTQFGPYGFVYDSLVEITDDAHLIVVGRVVGLRTGQLQPFDKGSPGGPMNVTFGIVAVDEVLKGVPQMRNEGTIEVARLGWQEFTAADLPSEQVILFLKNYAQLRQEEGVEPSEDGEDRYYYSRPNGYQCVLRSTDGRVDAIVPPGLEEVLTTGFPGDLHDRPFADIVNSVRDRVSASN